MTWLITVLSLTSAGCGALAAELWRRSSLIEVDPGFPMGIASGDEMQNIMGWVVGVMKAFSELNRKAAIWTAASVGLSAAGAITGLLPHSI